MEKLASCRAGEISMRHRRRHPPSADRSGINRLCCDSLLTAAASEASKLQRRSLPPPPIGFKGERHHEDRAPAWARRVVSMLLALIAGGSHTRATSRQTPSAHLHGMRHNNVDVAHRLRGPADGTDVRFHVVSGPELRDGLLPGSKVPGLAVEVHLSLKALCLALTLTLQQACA